ncbi:MAG TPA: hypothetical protein VLM80_06190 [Anaerolineales bacterium]|nr:hypothetical protein [Anaerolineales bacterium]
MESMKDREEQSNEGYEENSSEKSLKICDAVHMMRLSFLMELLSFETQL